MLRRSRYEKRTEQIFCTRSKKWSENRSSRFEPKIVLISFSRGSGPPLNWIPLRIRARSRNIQLHLKYFYMIHRVGRILTWFIVVVVLGKPSEWGWPALWFHNQWRMSTITDAKRAAPQGHWRQKNMPVRSASTSYSVFAWILAFFYIILYDQKAWVYMKHVCHYTWVCMSVLWNNWLHLHKYRCVLVYDINARDMCTSIHMYIHNYLSHVNTSTYRYTFPHISRILDMKDSSCIWLHNSRLLDDLAHRHLSHNGEGFVQKHKKRYSVRVERGSCGSHNLNSHWKQVLYWSTCRWHGEVPTR